MVETLPYEGDVDMDQDDYYAGGGTPVWINFALARVWALFQKNTKRLISDTFQPILDESEKPDFCTDVQLTRFVPGKQSPRVQSVRRLPSRAMSQVHYATRVIFTSTSITDFDVYVSFPNLPSFAIPVRMENLDVDATFWIASTLAPYEPFCTQVEYALLETPKVSFDIFLFRVLPITAWPVLRKLFVRIMTKEIPQEFRLPNTVRLDFKPMHIQQAQQRQDQELNDEGDADDETLRQQFPEQWSLFDAMDLDGNGSLSTAEISRGLQDWGYTEHTALEIFEQLDRNSDNKVSFVEFCQLWPSLQESLDAIPSNYAGELIVFLRKAKHDLAPLSPSNALRFGRSDPSVRLRLNGQEEASKQDSQTTGGGESGKPVWMQAFGFKCSEPESEELEVILEERGLPFLKRFNKEPEIIATAKIPLKGLAERSNKKLKVNLEPQGSMWLDLSYAEFVDEQQ